MLREDSSGPDLPRKSGWLHKSVARCHRGLRKGVNKLFLRWFGQDRPVFFDIDQTCPALRLLEENFAIIRDEVNAIRPAQGRIPLYHQVDPAQRSISSADKSWRLLVLHMYRAGSLITNRELCPRTVALVERIPNVFAACVSILEAGTSIPPHRGPYLGYLRYHMGLEVPTENPPSMRVKDRIYTWREGEGLLFDDSWQHEVFNRADEDRVVLMVDILRPMPWFLSLLNRLVVRIGAWKFLRRNITNATRLLDAAN